MKMNIPMASEFNKLRSVLEGPLGALDLERLGRHNRAYSRCYADQRFERYVEAEWPYYAKVLEWYRQHVPSGSSVLEIGTFIPVIPLLLAWEGYRVTTVEKLSLYGDALNPVLELLKQHEVTFLNSDIMEETFDQGLFDTVNLLAVVEHLLGSPKNLLARIHGMLRPEGRLVFIVPNQARLIRRLGLLFGGASVHGDYGDYFESEYPYEGHHREYTKSEVVYALTHSGFQLELLGSVKYPPKGGNVRGLVTVVANLLPSAFHQTLFAIGRKG
jgi:2-polyprenyl-3-methyl-5-hydroxy-6-metoxy-1,4-benzoquinol methylase